MEENFNTVECKNEKHGFLKWLDNFWYHYKWHSIIALFLVFTVTVCSLQMCSKQSYDIHVLYAGSHAFQRQGVDGDMPEYNKAKSTLSRFVSDYDGDGNVNVSLRDLFLPTAEQMEKFTEGEYQRTYEDRTNLGTLMTSSDYYLCFLSASVYESYKDPQRLMNLKALYPELDEEVFYDNTGLAIKLSSVGISTLSGFTELPSDTVICLRSTNFSSHLDRKSNEKNYNRAEETLRKILSFKAV